MNPARASGFTLIEVLVAVAILSFGMLGIAAMQITGVRANQGSYFRSQATFIASDMAERLYANRAGAQSGLYDGFDSSTQNCATAVTACSVTNTSGSAPAACDATAMKNYDLYAVTCGQLDGTTRVGGLTDLLPNGQLTITCPTAACAAGVPRRITVTWQERAQSSTTSATSTQQSGGQATLQTQTVTVDLVL